VSGCGGRLIYQSRLYQSPQHEEKPMHEQTIQEHVESNLTAAIDQSHEYDQFETYKEGDAYLQNTIDSCLEDGYSWNEASDAGSLFHKLASENGVRFHGEETTTQTSEEKPMSIPQTARAIVELNLGQSIVKQHDFKNMGLCFAYFYENTFDGALDDGFDDQFAEMVAEYFADVFNAHFKTDFVF
jgi:hypothetical protein